MYKKYDMAGGELTQRQRNDDFCLLTTLVILSLFLFVSFADANQSDFFLQRPDQQYESTEGKLQNLIDRLSKQLSSEPYRADLYYHLARAYNSQGWHEKAIKYTGQWLEFSSNRGMVMKGRHAFMVDEKNDKILVVDTIGKNIIKEINVDWMPRGMALATGRDQLYVTNALSNTVSSIDTDKLAVTNTVKVGRMPWNGKSSPQGDRVYVTNLKGDDVSVIDTETETVLETVKVGQGPWGIAVSPDGRRLYVSNQDSWDIQVVDTGDYSIVDIINIGTHPQDIALAPDDETKLYAIDRNVVSDEMEIYIVDLNDARVVKSLNMPGAGANIDPLLTRVEKMSLNDRLALIGIGDMAETEDQGPVKKPGIEYPPKVAFMPQSPVPSNRIITAEHKISEKTSLPVGGPAVLMGPEPPTEYYANVPTASSENSTPIMQVLPQKNSEEKKNVLRIVIVVKHDTLWKISMDSYGVADNHVFRAIQAINPAIKSADMIYVGQRIILPALDPTDKTVVVKRNDNLFRIALNNYGVVNEKIYAAILRENPHIEKIELIEVGQRIVLPALPRVFPRIHA